jgi:multidrug efflux pump subunit AcrB
MRGVNLSEWAVRRPTLVLYLMLAIAITGAFSYRKLGRAEDPSFTIKVAVVTAKWPGATASEVRDQLADPIEKKIQELAYLDKIETYVKPGFVAMQVSFRDFTPPREVPVLFYQLRKKLQDIRSDLPFGVLGPDVNDEFGDVDTVLYAVSGEGATYFVLDKVAETLRKRLLAVPDAVKIDVVGKQQRCVFVEFSESKIASLGISPQAIFESLAKQNAVVDAGVFETPSHRVRIEVTGALQGAEAIAAVPIEAGGKILRLDDLATVYPGFRDPPEFLARYNGFPAIMVGVVMAKGANVLRFGEAVRAAVAEVRAQTPVGVEIDQIADQPRVVAEAVGEFTNSFVEALVIVLLVSFASLGWRTGIVVALSVPLVLAIVFIFMRMMDIDLQRISLGALIIALGLLVDDAIIAVEMMMVKMEQGFDRIRAATFAWEATAFPMLTGTLITAAGFMPVGFANSGVGEYTGSMFWVLLVALIASWFVAVVFTPYLGVQLLPDLGKLHPHSDPDEIYRTPFYVRLRAIIAWAVDNRLRVIGATLAIFVLAVLGFFVVQKQFFPYAERLELFVQMQLPEGSSITASLAAAQQAEALVRGDPDVDYFSTYVGQGPPRFWLGLNPQLPNESYSEMVVLTKSVTARERLKAKLEAAVGQGAVPQARVRVERFSYGPPVGLAVQFRVIGVDPLKVREIAYRVRDVMGEEPGVLDPHLNWNEQTPIVRLVVDQERARLLGLTPQDISDRLRLVISGVTVATLRDGVDQVAVVVRAEPAERGDLSHLGDIVVYTRDGKPVTVSQVARVVYEHEEPIVWRRNRDMMIRVQGGVKDGVQGPDASSRIWARLAPLQASLPPGYRIEMGGAIEESEKGNASIFGMFPLVALMMLTIVMVQLQDFMRAGLVMMSAPLGVIGASLALNVAHAPMGFVAMLGLFALSGMDMRNSIILVDQVRQDLEAGDTYREAIIGATVRRVRPVMLTALAAILAMLPLTRSAFWGPMALTIMGGLFVATFLTVLFLPALYATWFRKSLDRGLAASSGAAPATVETFP